MAAEPPLHRSRKASASYSPKANASLTKRPIYDIIVKRVVMITKKQKSSERHSLGDGIMKSKPAVLSVAIAGILLGLFFVFSQNANTPIPRSEAVSYSGEFEEYEVWRNYRTIHFKDGSSYAVYAHTETQAFQNMMKSLEKGTRLYILVNPNNDCVIEIKTDTEELLNFETSQAEIDSYDNGYIAIGIVACISGVLLIAYVIGYSNYKRKEDARHLKKAQKRVKGQDDSGIRRADRSVKSKILLEASVKEYSICYRRVKSINELVINGIVYDEKKGIIEFDHNLSAVIDGHKIEAGYDENSYSYIIFDGKRIAEKRRII